MRRIFTRSLFMMLMILSAATVWAQKSVLDENFANGKPADWTTAGSYWKFQNANALFEALVQDGADTLFAPAVSLDELTNHPSVAITYSNAANADKKNTLKVLYRESEADAWSELQTFFEATDGQVDWKGQLPDGLSNVQIALAGAYLGGAETRVYRLSIENKTEAAIAPSGLRYEDLTTTSVTLVWNPCTSDMFLQYNIKVSTTALTDMYAEADVLDRVGWQYTDEWYELAGLNPNTQYYAYVQYDCGDGDVSPWAELNFATPCAAIGAPYLENFENGLSGCYTVINNSTAATVSSEYPYNSTQSFKFVTTKGNNSYLILPEMSSAVKAFQINFMAAAQEGGTAYARTITVGVCTDATAESFTELTTMNLPKGRQWENIIVSLAGYKGNGRYIALRAGNADKENRIFIDDIKIEPLSACPQPMFLNITEVTPNSAKLSWVKSGAETEWNLVVSQKPLADPEEIEPDATKGEFAGAISSNPYILNNLRANTTYYVYLQAGCGSSEWTKATEFMTAKEVSYPYSEHFDRMNPDSYTNNKNAVPDGWIMDARGVNPNYYFDYYYGDTYLPYVTTNYNHEATPYVSASLYLCGSSKSDNNTAYYSSIAMLPAMPKAVKEMRITFWAYSETGDNTVMIGVADNQTADLAMGQQLGVNIIKVDSVLIPSSKWTKFSISLKKYAGTGRYITFFLSPGISTPKVYIDDIEIDDIPDCSPVNNLAAEAEGIDKANVSWTDATSSTSWRVKVSSTEIDPENSNGDIVNTTTDTKSYAATGLSMGTTYYIYVSPACEDMWESTSITTPVGLSIPFYTDFSGETTGSVAARGPKNWTLGSTGSALTGAVGTQTWVPYLNTGTSTSSGWPNEDERTQPFLHIYNGTTASQVYPYAIMPRLLNAEVKDLKLGFYIYTSNTSTAATYAAKANQYYNVLKIGVVESPSAIGNDISNIVEVAAVRCKVGRVSEYVYVDMSTCPEDKKDYKYIVFYQDTLKTNYSFIDNLTIARKTDPWKVSNIVVSNITETGANLTWQENGVATQWNVKVFKGEPENVDTDTPVFNTMVSTPEVTISGLNHSTEYYAYVQSTQANGESEWTKVSFWTETGAWALPFEEDFDSYYATSSYRTLPNYYEFEASGTYLQVYDLNGEQYVKQQSTSSYKVTTFALPPFDKPISTLEMTFRAHADATSSSTESAIVTAIQNSSTEIGVLEADGTFVPVGTIEVSSNEWEDKYINFQSYSGTGGKIAIRTDYNKKNATNAIRYDDIVVREIPACGRLVGVSVTEIDSTSANLSWTKIKAETKWNLKVSSIALNNPETEIADVFDGQVETPSKELSGLEGSTKYYIYVQTVDEVNGCVGSWSSATVFKTLCQLQGFPYEENFDEYRLYGIGNIPDCSTLSGEDVNHSYVTARVTNQPNRVLYLRQVTKDHNNYFAFPAMMVDSVKRLQLSMKVNPGGTTTTNYYYYEVGVMTDPNDRSTFVSVKLDSVQGAANTVFYDKTYTFEGYYGDDYGVYGTYIAIKPLQYRKPGATSYFAGSLYIDDVVIDYVETCRKPTDLTAVEVGIDTVKLSWLSDNDPSAEQRVRLYTNADANPAEDAPIAEVIVNASEAVIRGLAGNTLYHAFVRAECGENDYSKWSTIYSFRTNCPEMTSLPYVETFEDGTAGSTPFCWTSLLLSGSSAKAQVVATGTSNYAFESEKAMSVNYAYSQNGSSSYTKGLAAAVTPALDVENLKDVLMYCDIRSGSTAHDVVSLKIEAVSDNTTNADAIYITTINDITTTWTKAYIKLGEFYNSVQPYRYLRFTPQTTKTSASATVYIDNITFTTDLNTVLPITELKPVKVADSSIEFSFSEVTPGVDAWKYACVISGGNIADATVTDIDTTYVVVSGLTPNTSYDVYVCANVAGSDWVGPITMTTCTPTATIPYATGFEDDVENAMWEFQKLNAAGNPYPNNFMFGNASNCDATGTKALYVSNNDSDYQYVGNVAYSYVSRTISVENAGSYMFSIKAKVPGNTAMDKDGDFVCAHLVPAGSTFMAGSIKLLDGTSRSYSSTADGNNCYSLVGKVTHVNEWTTYTKKIDVTEAGAYTIVIVWTNNKTPTPGLPAAIDSVMAEEYFCTTPSDVEYTERSTDEVSLKWFAGRCTDFEYVVSRYSRLGDPLLIDAEDKVAAGITTAGPQVTIGNLQSSTKYSFYVRTLCQDGPTDWVEYCFETPCGPESLPYTESFSTTPECWILSAATAKTCNYYTEDMKASGAEIDKWPCLELSNNGIAILPQLEIPLSKVMIEVAAFNGQNEGSVSIGTVDNTWDKSSYKEIGAITPEVVSGSISGAVSGSGYPYKVKTFSKMLNLYTGTGKNLALRNTSGSTVYIKYVKLTELADCMQPYQIEVTNITENTASVHWIAGIENEWEIKMNDGTPITVTENPYILSNLEQGSDYSISVRAICDATHTSEWSAPIVFKTTCGAYSLPMEEDFGDLAYKEKAEIQCWEQKLSDKPIQNVFNGTASFISVPKQMSYSYTWTANWLNALGDRSQLFSWDYNNTYAYSEYKYRWFISPQYIIAGNATLSFDARMCDNVGAKAKKPLGRFFVAISTDNGVTWLKENAYNLTEELDSVYTTKSISLEKYIGQNIRVAFYHEGLSSGMGANSTYVLIDNVRMNCSETYPMADNACQGYDYEGNGFVIVKEDLPLAGKDSTYYRFAANTQSGCDSVVALTITTRTPATATVYETICAGETFDFGPYHLSEPNPVGTPYYITGETQYGCDSTIYLYLTVNPSDTAVIAPIEVDVNQLPYQVDELFTVPAGTAIGELIEIVKVDACHFNRYDVTVKDLATGLIYINSDVDHVDVYDILGRKIQTIVPQVGELQLHLPTGVYMLRTTMTNGQIETNKISIK